MSQTWMLCAIDALIGAGLATYDPNTWRSEAAPKET